MLWYIATFLVGYLCGEYRAWIWTKLKAGAAWLSNKTFGNLK